MRLHPSQLVALDFGGGEIDIVAQRWAKVGEHGDLLPVADTNCATKLYIYFVFHDQYRLYLRQLLNPQLEIGSR